jgi:DNA repair protein RadD
MLTPRDYQDDAVDSFFNYYAAGNKGNPIIVAATGAGKSLILAELIRRIMTGYANQRVIMATHVADLVAQNAQKVISQYPSCNLGIYSAGLGKKQPWADVIYGGIQSMYKYPERFGRRDLLFIDEAHLLSPKSDGMYMEFIKGLKKANPHLKVIGLSATPWRQKGGSLIDQEDAIFTDIIYDISLGYLIKRGFLTGLVGKSSIIQADLSGLKGPEFTASQLEQAFDKEELTDAALDEVEQLAFDRKHFLFFCSGLDHCAHVEANLTARGWECYTITGSTTQRERDFLLNKFRRSRTRIALINNTVLTTGTDLPCADCLVFLRGTKSSGLFIQICGRVARTVYAAGYDLSTDAGRLAAIANGPKPSALILDYGGNIQRFGAVDLIEAPRKNNNSAKSGEPTSPPQKICPSCREPLHITVRECHCGHIFDSPERINHETAASTLAIMSTEMASTKHAITKALYKSHVAKSGVPCLRVQYYDAMGFLASDYIPFSQFGNVRERANEWFREVTDVEHHTSLPKNTEEALAVKHLYNCPSFIHMRKKGQYQEIIKREYAETLLTNNI